MFFKHFRFVTHSTVSACRAITMHVLYMSQTAALILKHSHFSIIFISENPTGKIYEL